MANPCQAPHREERIAAVRDGVEIADLLLERYHRHESESQRRTGGLRHSGQPKHVAAFYDARARPRARSSTRIRIVINTAKTTNESDPAITARAMIAMPASSPITPR